MEPTDYRYFVTRRHLPPLEFPPAVMLSTVTESTEEEAARLARREAVRLGPAFDSADRLHLLDPFDCLWERVIRVGTEVLMARKGVELWLGPTRWEAFLHRVNGDDQPGEFELGEAGC